MEKEKTRICKICELDLPENDIYFASRKDRNKKEFQVNCRECQKKYRRQHYLNNKQKYIDKAHDYRLSFVEWFSDFKKNFVCEECGEKRYWVLDFHHKDPNEKDADVSTLVRQCNKTKILAEIKKCCILCSNCHRDFHHKEKNKIADSL